jgi:23S rRNA pseudouridine1911/1915/1917 synthase
MIAEPMTLTATPDDTGRRLDIFLHQHMPQFSRARLQEWIKCGSVLVNGDSAKPSQLLRGDETLHVTPKAPTPLRAFAEDLPIQTLYEDAAVIAVDKPAGMVVHMGSGNHSGTLVNALLHKFEQLSDVNGDERPGIVHRLDRETSGVLLVAKTDVAHRALAEQFESRTIEKYYLALVHGVPRQIQGRVTTPIERDPKRRLRMTTKSGNGRESLTTYTIKQRWEKHALLEVRIHTGRTHQIRVHLASVGHAVVGDIMYGAPQSTLGRFFLHSHRITFLSPATGKPVTIESPLPSELEQYLQGL